MEQSIWKDFSQEYINKPLEGVKKFFIELKLLFVTVFITIINPHKLLFSKDEVLDKVNEGKEDWKDKSYLSAVRASIMMLKLIFILSTIHAFLSLKAEGSDLDGTIAQYFIFVGYYLSLFVLLIYSYVFNLTGSRKLKLENTNVTTAALVYMFNVIYLVIIVTNFINIDPDTSMLWLISFSVLFAIIFLWRIGRKLGYSRFSLIVNSVLVIFLIGFIVLLNLLLTTSYGVEGFSQ